MSQDHPDSVRDDPAVGVADEVHPVVVVADEVLPWAEMLDKQLMQIYVEYNQNDEREKINVTRRHTFLEIKTIICRSCCTTPDKIILYWMGDEMQDDVMLADVVGWRDACSTTFHCEDRELRADRELREDEWRADRGVKRARSSRSSGSGCDLAKILLSSSK